MLKMKGGKVQIVQRNQSGITYKHTSGYFLDFLTQCLGLGLSCDTGIAMKFTARKLGRQTVSNLNCYFFAKQSDFKQTSHVA